MSERKDQEKASGPKDDVVQRFDTLIKNAYSTIVKCTKTALSFPSTHENSLLIASPNYINNVATTNDKVMDFVDKLLKSQNVSKSLSKLYLEGQKDILIEANDKLLESINTRIDVMAGVKTANALPSEPKVVKEGWNKNAKSSNIWQEVKSKKSNFFKFNNNSIINEKPQQNFKDKVDNSDTIFEPKIKEKPNSLKPLSILLEKYDSLESYSHPYEYELDLFVPKGDFLSNVEPQEPLSLSDTPLILVDELAGVIEMLDDLKQQSAIAVDLEYHNYRSFQGYTCLMQISTRKKDYIVDTLKLRGDLEPLNEVFTNSKILKVFHGGESDIKWLQKDFGIYVVGMFDTYQACKFLPFPRQSLAYLLKHYCTVDTDKTFQLFDWRKRPLPEQAITYARCDTHYLLYIYDCMKKDLLDAAHGKQNLLMSTFSNSVNSCKLKYIKPVFHEDGYMSIFRSHSLLTNQQKYALRELYKWRDQTAREMDESTGYILPNHMLLQMSQSIPRDVQGIFACCNPVPQPVKEHVLTIHSIILKARLQPMTKPVEKVKSSDEPLKRKKKAVPMPHDSMDSENYKGLPPVFGDGLSPNKQNLNKRTGDFNGKTEATIKLFFQDDSKKNSNKVNKIKLKTSSFETPYRRFLKSKEYAKALDAKNEKENDDQKNSNAPNLDLVKIENTPVKQIKKESVSLKQVKCEETIEMEKEKRKKILREREDDGDDVDVVLKKPKIEKDNTSPKQSKKKLGESSKQTVELANGRPKKKEVKSGPKDKSHTVPIKPAITEVDFSKVNYNKFMVKNNNKKTNKKNKRK